MSVLWMKNIYKNSIKMPKHHSEDYKITAVKHYVNKSKNLSKTCKIFECSRISLKRWVNRYKRINQ